MRAAASIAPLVLLLLCVAAQVLAQTSTRDSEDTTYHAYELGEIIVYGESVTARTSLVTEYDAVQLEELGARSIADALRSEPALSITTGPKAETETRVRGFPAFDVLVRVDGHPVNPGYYGKVDLSMIPVENIERLQVIKGPASVAYGVNSMGGVIDITTRRGTERPSTMLSSEFGDYEYRKLGLHHSSRTGIFSYAISGYEQFARGFVLSEANQPTSLENGGLRDHSSFHKAGSHLRVGARVGQDVHLALSTGYHWARKDIPSTIYSWDSPTHRTIPRYERYNATLSSQWFINERLLVQAQSFFESYHDQLIDYKSEERDERALNYDSFLGSWSVGGSAKADYTLSAQHALQAGVQFATDRMEKQSDANLPFELRAITGGHVFVQDTYSPWQSTEVIAGMIASFSNRDRAEKSSHAFSPMLSIRQQLPFDLVGYASYANSIRYPALHHLYSQASGNPDLWPESADKMEIGFQRTFLIKKPAMHILMECALFNSLLHNLIYRSGKSYRYNNIAENTLRGLEFSIRCNVGEVLFAAIGYMLLDRDASSAEIMEETSPQTLRAQLSTQTAFGMRLRYEYRNIGMRSTHFQTRELSPYSIHIVRITQSIIDRIRVSIEINNVTDSHYEDELGYPAAGRQLVAGIQYQLQ